MNIRRLAKKVLGLIVTICTLATVAITGGAAVSTAWADDAYTAVDGSNSTSQVEAFTDQARTQPLTEDTKINVGDTVYASINIDFKDGTGVPSQAKPNVSYAFPENMNVKDYGPAALPDDNGNPAGTWRIENNKIYVEYNDSFFDNHTSGINLKFNFEFSVGADDVNDGNQTTITLPGGQKIVINFNPPQVNGVKTSSVNPDGKSVTFTTVFTADRDTDKFAFADAMEEGLTFREDSFEFDGQPLTGVQVDNAATPRTAKAEIGDLTGGKDAQGNGITHTLTYQADLTDAAKAALLSGEIPKMKNTINWTWGEDGTGSTDTTPTISYKPVAKNYVSYDDATGTAQWKITLNSGQYKTDMAGYTVSDALKPAEKIGDGEDPDGSAAQTFTEGASIIVRDSAGNQIGEPAAVHSDGTFSYTFPADKAYDGEYTIEYTTTLTEPNTQRKYNNEVTLSKGDYSSSAPASYSRTGGFNDVNKATPTRNADGTITWTVTVNGGTFKRDFAGVAFTDTLEAGMHYVGDFKVTPDPGDGTSRTLPTDADTFSYTFPANAGKKQYVITYNTAMNDPTKLVTYGNEATVEGGVIPGGSASSGNHYDNTHKGQDETYLKKSITSDDSIDTGVVAWKVVVKPGDLITNSTNLSFVDYLTGGWSASGVRYDQGSLTAKDKDGVALDATAYTVTWGATQTAGAVTSCVDGAQPAGGSAPCFGVAFKDAALNNGDITLEYTTTAKNPNVAGTYGNDAVLNKDDASFKGTDNVTVPPNAIQKSGAANWDAESKTWGIDYTIDVNKNTDSSVQRAGIDNLRGKPVTLIDTLSPDPSNADRKQQYVAGSAQYTLTLTGKDSVTKSVEPELSQDGAVLTFEIPTSDVCASDEPCYVSIQLKYRVTVPTDPFGSTVYKNEVTGTTPDATFAGTSSSTTVNTKVLSKEGASDGSWVQPWYKVDVNPSAQEIRNNDKLVEPLVMVDRIDYRTTLVTSSVLVCKGDLTVAEKDISTASCDEADGDITSSSNIRLASVTNDEGHPTTELRITVPNATHVTVFYRVLLSGEKNQQVSGVTNNVNLEGVDNTATDANSNWTVAEASGGTSGATGNITINKVDADNASKNLGGAKFELYRIDGGTSWDGNAAGSLVDTQTTASSGSLKFSKDGASSLTLNTLYYFVETEAPQGYHLDSTKHYFVLQDYKQAAGYQELVEHVKTITGAYPASNATYTVGNKLLAPVSFPIAVHKQLTGRTLANGEFTFTLHENNADGQVLQTKTNAADGSVNFDAISYDHEGTFNYSVVETKGDKGGVTYNTDPVNVSVTVKDDGTGKLVASASYGTQTPSIVNTYAATGQFTPQGVKSLTGRDAVASDSFAFTVKDSDGATVSTGKVANLSESGNIVFTPISYTLTDAGKTFQYTVSEDATDTDGKSTLPAGVTATTGSLAFTVAVSDKGDGTLDATPTYPDSGDHLDFVNTYAVDEVPLQISGTKLLSADGTNTTIGDFDAAFTFTLAGSDDAGNAAPLPVDENGKPRTESVNDNVGNVSFGTITYKQSDLADAEQHADGSRQKIFHYNVTESEQQPAGVKADPSLVRAFDVTVTDDGLGHLTAVAAADDQGGNDTDALFRFTNSYAVTPVNVSVTDAVTVTKKLVNAQLQAGQFHFELIDVESGKVVATASNAENGAVKFDAIEYTKPGTWRYQLKEGTPQGAVVDGNGHVTKNGTVYDSSVFDIVVNVTDQHDGTLSATVDRTDHEGKNQKNTPIEFVNTAPKPETPANALGKTGSDIVPIIVVAAAAAVLGLGLTVVFRKREQRSGAHERRR